MTDHHFDAETAEQYILGALNTTQAAELEVHASTCASCAQMLQREALLEELLPQIAARSASRVMTPVRLVRRWAPLAVALAAAVTGILLFSPKQHRSPVSSTESAAGSHNPQSLLICPGDRDREACSREARARGLMVRDANGSVEVPRYESNAVVPANAATLRSPASL